MNRQGATHTLLGNLHIISSHAARRNPRGVSESWDMLFDKRKNYTNTIGGNNANTPNKEQHQTTCLLYRAPLNCGSGSVCFYLQKADQANVFIYIEECKGVPSTHKTGTVTVVNLKRKRRNLWVLRQTDPCGLLT